MGIILNEKLYQGERGFSAFQVWQAIEGNEDKTEQDYLDYLRQPSVEALTEAVETTDQNVLDAQEAKEDAEFAAGVTAGLKNDVIQLKADTLTLKEAAALSEANASAMALTTGSAIGSIAPTDTAPTIAEATVGFTKRLFFTGAGSCAWITNWRTNTEQKVKIGDYVIVTVTAPSTYTYTWTQGQPSLELYNYVESLLPSKLYNIGEIYAIAENATISDTRTVNASLNSLKYPVVAGDRITIKGVGGVTGRLYAITDSSNNVIIGYRATGSLDSMTNPVVITVPANGAFLFFNSYNPYAYEVSIEHNIKKRIDVIEPILDDINKSIFKSALNVDLYKGAIQTDGTINYLYDTRVTSDYIKGNFDIEVNTGYVIRRIALFNNAKVFSSILADTSTTRTSFSVTTNSGGLAIITIAKTNDTLAILPTESIIKSIVARHDEKTQVFNDNQSISDIQELQIGGQYERSLFYKDMVWSQGSLNSSAVDVVSLLAVRSYELPTFKRKKITVTCGDDYLAACYLMLKTSCLAATPAAKITNIDTRNIMQNVTHIRIVITRLDGGALTPTDNVQVKIVGLPNTGLLLPIEPILNYGSLALTDGNTVDVPANVAAIYSLWDALVTAYPAHVERINCETLTSAVKPVGLSAYNFYAYHISPNTKLTSYSVGSSVPDSFNANIRIMAMCYVHGNERITMPSLLTAVKNLLANWATNDALNVLRDGVDLWVIPCLNPTGYDANTRGNYNSVDINRNFPSSNWVAGTDSLFSLTFGASAGSEYETKIAMALYNHVHPHLGLDFHNFSGQSKQGWVMPSSALFGKSLKIGLRLYKNLATEYAADMPDLYDNTIFTESNLLYYTGDAVLWMKESGSLLTSMVEVNENLGWDTKVAGVKDAFAKKIIRCYAEFYFDILALYSNFVTADRNKSDYDLNTNY